jgi:hypothetical protein
VLCARLAQAVHHTHAGKAPAQHDRIRWSAICSLMQRFLAFGLAHACCPIEVSFRLTAAPDCKGRKSTVCYRDRIARIPSMHDDAAIRDYCLACYEIAGRAGEKKYGPDHAVGLGLTFDGARHSDTVRNL